MKENKMYSPDSITRKQNAFRIRGKLVPYQYEDIARTCDCSTTTVHKNVHWELKTPRVRAEICRIAGATEAELWPVPEEIKQAAA